MNEIYRNDFQNGDDWLIESNGTVTFEDGSLRWACDGGTVMGTIWCTRRFEGPALVAYDVECLAGSNNMNFILYGRTEGDDLLATTATRTGVYAEYQTFPNYIATYLTDDAGKTRIRFRRNPGFALLSETYVDAPITQGKSMHVETKVDASGRISLACDGTELHSTVDPDPLPLTGYFGFRTWNTTLRYRNFRVYAL